MEQLARCPVCGGPLPELPGLQVIDGCAFYNGKRLHLNNMEMRVFLFLWNGRERYQAVESIHNHLYGNDPSGGPESNAIRVFISRIRCTLRAQKVPIILQSIYQRGYSVHVLATESLKAE